MESNHLNKIISIIQEKLNASGGEVNIPLKNGRGNFTVKLMPGGVEVSNLNTAPFLQWAVFAAAVEMLIHRGGSAKKGNAMHFKLGEDGLPINSIEGYIASKVYNKNPGDWVFRRITPVAHILDWAGICENGHGELKLANSTKESIEFNTYMCEDDYVDKPINGKNLKPKAKTIRKQHSHPPRG